MKRYEVCSWFIDGLWAGAISLKTAGGAASVGRCCPRTFLAPYPNPYPEPIPRTRTQFTRTPYRTTARTTARTTVPNSAPNYGSPPSGLSCLETRYMAPRPELNPLHVIRERHREHDGEALHSQLHVHDRILY